MAYGLSLNDLPKINKVKTYFVNDQKIFGFYEHGLGCWELDFSDIKNFPTIFFKFVKCSVYVHSGDVNLTILEDNDVKNNINMKKFSSFLVDYSNLFSIRALKKSIVYLIFHTPIFNSNILDYTYLKNFNFPKTRINKKKQPLKTFDYRSKYWGQIFSIFSHNWCSKIMTVKSNTRGSLEYHLKKTEYYWIISGTVFIEMRYGRGLLKIKQLKKGNFFKIEPGVMHRRITKNESCEILEISNKDNDKDSFIVEAGGL